MTAIAILEAYRDAGVPDGVFNLVMGPGDTVGDELQHNPGIDGIVFTGSFEVGFELFRNFSTRFPRPCIVEMGGKNPAIVLRSADLEEAAEGIMRSAFGFGGQKCSANSRVYVEKPVHDELVRLLVEKTEKLAVGDPLPRPAFLGPVIDQRAVDRHQRAVADARRDGAVFTGGEHLTDGDLARGFYVEPTVVGKLPGVAPAVPGRAVRAVHGGPRRRLARRGARARQRQRLRPDRGRLLVRSGRGPAVPRRDRGRRPVRQPARRGDDRARGRASRRSAAGRAPAPPARPACRCTTSRSSCGSRATPSSTRPRRRRPPPVTSPGPGSAVHHRASWRDARGRRSSAARDLGGRLRGARAAPFRARHGRTTTVRVGRSTSGVPWARGDIPWSVARTAAGHANGAARTCKGLHGTPHTPPARPRPWAMWRPTSSAPRPTL